MNEPSSASSPRSLPIDVGTVVAFLYVLSGATALVYQLAFVRAFVELFGSTAAALGATVGAFLFCLAAGALLASAIADRSPRPLRLYAKLEAVAALGGLLAAALLPRLAAMADSLAAQSIEGAGVGVMRLTIAVGVLLLPVGAMGATLPVLARFRAQDRSRGSAAGVLQVANTFGALIGVLVAAWVLIPSMGLRGTVQVAAAGNALLAVAAWVFGGFTAVQTPAPSSGAREAEGRLARSGEADASATGALHAAPFLVAAAISGFVLVSIEVLFFRGLAQLTRGSLESIATLLGAVLLSNALGSAVGTLLARDDRSARSGFLIGHLCTAAAVLFGLSVLYRIDQPGWEFLLAGHEAYTLTGRALGEAYAALVIAGPAAFFAGLAFPCVCRLVPRRPAGFGRWVAWQSAAWTLGAAAAGALAAPWLVPGFSLPLGLPRVQGLQGGLLLVAGLSVLAVLVVLAVERARLWRGQLAALGGGGALLALFVLLPAGERSIWNDELEIWRLGMGPEARLLAYGEGEVANVAVVLSEEGRKLLKVNNQQSLGGSGASGVEGMQALLPSLLHPDPKRALVLGVGAGVTVGTLSHSGVPEVEAVELVPMVLRSLPLFALENGGVRYFDEDGVGRSRDGVTIHEEDARTFVRGAEEGSYDLIVGDLFFPWQAEAGFLYTREHFARCKELLAPGGVFCQWLPAHQLRWEELGIVGRTFAEVFDGATMWWARADSTFPVVGLVAGKESLRLSVSEIRERVEEHPQPELLEKFEVEDYRRLLAHYCADEFLFRSPRVFEREELNTVDRPIVEFLASQRLETDAVTGLNNRRHLFEHKEDIIGRMSTAGLEQRERAALQKELVLSSKLLAAVFDATTHRLLADANRSLPPGARQNDPRALDAAAYRKLAFALDAAPEDRVVIRHLSMLLEDQLRRGEFANVLDGASQLLSLETVGTPSWLLYLRGRAQLITACVRQEDDPGSSLRRATEDLRQVLDDQPENLPATVHLGISLFLAGEDGEALRRLQEARARMPEIFGAQRERLSPVPEAIYQFLTGEPELAEQLLRQGMESGPFRSAVAARIAM